MKELLFTLTPSDGVPVTIQHAPDGWDEAFIITERSRKYHGIYRSFTLPMKFIKDAAGIIRGEFYTHGTAGVCAFEVQKLDKVTLTYYTAFTGSLIFESFKDHDYDVEITAIDGGLAHIIKTRESDDVTFTKNDFQFVTNQGPIAANIYPQPPLGHTFRYIWCMRFMQAFRAIVDRITDGGITSGRYAVRSNFLASGEVNSRYFLVTESALKLPGIDQSTAGTFTYKTSLQDFFKTCDALWCLGMGIELIDGVETIVIEQREYFYNTGVILNVGNSKNLSLGIVSEFNFANIRVGYPNKSYGSDNSSGGGTPNYYEPNTETTFKVPAVQVKGEYDIVSKYRGDSVGIDQIWESEVNDLNTGRDTGDSDLVILRLGNILIGETMRWVHTDGSLSKKDDPGIVVAYPWNLESSPRRMLNNHIRFINGCARWAAGQDVALLSATNDQANNITGTGPGGTNYLNEYDGFTVSDTGTWFTPVELIVEAAYPADFVSLIDGNPYGVIEFEYRGGSYRGYIMRMETKLSGAGSIKYSLLSTGDNNLQKLIR